MNIGILGTGDVGTSLATGLADAGHIVMLGSRDPSKLHLSEWVAEDPAHRRVGDYGQAADFGDFVIMAVPGRVLGDALDLAGPEAFAGSIVIDATNPVVRTDQGAVDFYGDNDSGAEFLQRELPGVPVVKAFNQVLAPYMLHPEQSSIKVLRIAGNDVDAKRRVTELLEEFGWDVRDLGPLEKARDLERGVVEWIRGERGSPG